MAKAQQSKLVHELRDGLHRIVVIEADSNSAGEWVPQSDVAVSANGKLFAISGESPLPQGIFSTVERGHQVLS